ILLYIESIHKRRNFMSAARAAARNKPTLVIKSGRFAEGAKAAASHTGALAGSDIVYDAAFRRAGMLRVHDIEELFAAVETLARGRPLHGERLAIMTNGGGLGVMAVDDLIEGGGVLAGLSKKTLSALDSVLPETWSRSNPVDIIGDASGERYAATLKILSQDKGVDAVLVMHAPTGTASSTDAAQAVIDSASKTKTYILTSWVGGESVAQARNMFADTGIPTYATPDQAVNGFLHMVNYRRNQELLMETPLAAPTEFRPDVDKVRALVAEALKTETTMMREPEAKAVLAAYGIPTIETHIATTSRDAAEIARKIGFPVALKILSEDIPHKSDVGGVNLFLESPEAVRGAAEIMLETIAEKLPNCRIEGFTVQKMALRPGAHELIIGVASDPIFGPVILFGQGGTAVEIIADRAVALPPLNMRLARELIDRTRIVRLLTGYRDRPPIDMDALCLTLMQVSQLVIDIPELVELDINPLFADDKGVLALDARIGLDAKAAQIPQRLAIRPYPGELEEIFSMPSGRKILLRPIRPEDEPQHYKFIASLSPEDIRFRFFGLVKTLPHSQMARFTQIDYDREMAFIASGVDEGGGNETLGVVRTITDPNNEATEFAIVVRSDLKGQGLGSKLLGKMIAYCKGRGTRRMVGQILRENHRMLELASKIGFQRHHIEDETAVEVTLDLTKATT
ncbi:MAG: bifunctional acetate--CoA ligase family protein/GNAT family N-acetyltransferase, partial [Rhodospirillales bacterium]|nr:bifunctional acetate--CoA ligase family protein/GNAT family N-acetyltransferase [Rhodospirillales bacterium]